MLYRAKAILSKLSKELGGNRIRTADWNWPKGYSIPYDIMRKQFWRRWRFISLSLSSSAQGGSHKCYHFPFLLSYQIVSSQPKSSTFFFPDPLPSPPLGKGRSKQKTVWCSATCQLKPQQSKVPSLWEKDFEMEMHLSVNSRSFGCMLVGFSVH